MVKPGARIAVVDDDKSVRKALARLLAASSFEIRTYGSAREFIKSDPADVPECLVLDLHMPEIGGLDLQKLLRKAGIRIPTVVITAYSEPGLLERCQAAGATTLLTKPLDGQALVEAVYAAMEGSKAES